MKSYSLGQTLMAVVFSFEHKSEFFINIYHASFNHVFFLGLHKSCPFVNPKGKSLLEASLYANIKNK